jgi:hypothetical protein
LFAAFLVKAEQHPLLTHGRVRNTLSPHTTGVEFPRSGSSTFHFTFSVVLHFVGRSVSSVTPSLVGPRHEGQLPASVDGGVQIPISSIVPVASVTIH